MIISVLFLGILTFIMLNTFQFLGLIHHDNMFLFSVECLISMIVVCCPCSIGLTSALVSVQVSALLNERGIIMRKDSLIEDANHLSSIVFDKTGTLVDNHLVVCDLKHEFNLECIGKESGYKLEQVMLDKTAVQQILYTLARDTNHPVSLAIANTFRCQTTLTDLKRDHTNGSGVSGSFIFLEHE